MKALKIILIIVLAVLLIAGAFLTITDGIKDLITQAMAKIIEILTDPTWIKTLTRKVINSIKNFFDTGEFVLPESDEYIVVIDNATFLEVKNNIANIVNTKASGYSDLVIKKMLLVYYTSLCTHDTEILISLTDDEFDEFKNSGNSSYDAEEITGISGITDGKYLKTHGIVKLYLNGTEEIRFLSQNNITDVVSELNSKTNLIDSALGKFYGIDKLGTIKLYTSTNESNTEYFKYGEEEQETQPETEIAKVNSGGVTFDYTMYTSDYVVPVELLADFLNFTESAEFIDKFAKLQENSEIKLGIYETSVTTRTYETIQYNYEVEFNVDEEWEEEDSKGEKVTKTANTLYSTGKKEVKEHSNNKTTRTNYEMQLMEVNNWFVNIKQNNTINTSTTYQVTNSSGELVDAEEDTIAEKYSDSAINEDAYYISATSSTINENPILFKAVETEESGIKDQVKAKSHEYNGWTKVNYYKTNATQSKSVTTITKCVNVGIPDSIDNTDKFLALLSTESGVYSEDDVNNGRFKSKASGGKVVKYKNIYNNGMTGAGEMLENGAEALFQILEDSLDQDNKEIGSNTQGLVELMKYIIWRYSGTDYGVTSFNLVLSNYSNLSLVSGGESVALNDTSLFLTKEELKKAIESMNLTSKQKSNLLSSLDAFIKIQDDYKVNAAFAVAVTIIESSAGTSWAAISSSTYNWMSVTGSYNGKSYRNPSSSNPRTWKVYPSFSEATIDFGNLIANSPYYYKAGKYTVTDIAPTYCNADWGESVSAIMNKIYGYTDKTLYTGTFGDEEFLAVAKKCYEYLNSNHFEYDSKYAKRIPVTSSSTKVTDCSHYVSWVLYEYGYTEIGSIQKDHAGIDAFCRNHGFQQIAIKDVQPGDILIWNNGSHQHTEIVKENVKITYNCGTTTAIQDSTRPGVAANGVADYPDRAWRVKPKTK